MSVVQAGGADYSTAAGRVSSGQHTNAARPTEFGVWINNGTIWIAGTSQKQVDDLMARISLKSDKPISELSIRDVYSCCSWSGFDTQRITNGDKLYTKMVISESLNAIVQTFNRQQYFLDDVPVFPPGSGRYLNSSFDTSSTGIARDTGLAGLVGAARHLYKGNYGDRSTVSLGGDVSTGPNGVTAEVLKLMQALFGQSGDFNVGHLNVLKMMGLVNGSAEQGVNTWQLTDKGTAIAGNMGENFAPAYLPSLSLIDLPLDIQLLAGGIGGYFSAEGKLINSHTVAEIEKAAKEILKAMVTSSDAGLPSGLSVDPNTPVGKMLNQLFSMGANNTVFTVGQINTAISMGLITRSGDSVAITQTGQYYSAEKDAAIAANATPPADANKPAELSPQQKLAQSLDYLRTGYFDVFDVGRSNSNKDDDYYISYEDISRLAGISEFDSAWDEGVFSNVPGENRKDVIGIAKLLKQMIDENPSAWQELTRGGDGFSESRMLEFLAQYNSNQARLPTPPAS